SEHIQIGNRIAGEQVAGQVSGQPPKQTGPEQDTGEYLPDDGGLAASPCRRAKQGSDDENERDIAYDGCYYGVH
ncbi:MAG TPA: hypothetical protein VN714_06850, partial [Trebonia sp.]|nr:hypothetical protein [Trebonia sp.]